MIDWLRHKLGLTGTYYDGWGMWALLRERVRIAAHDVAWPPYDCQFCVGQEYGCWCQHYGACAPGVGPMRRDLALRWIYRKIWGGDRK